MKLRSFIAPALALVLSVAGAQAQTNPGTSPLSGAKGGTNNAFMQFTGPATSIKTFTLPNATDTIATLGAIQTFSAAKTFASSTLLLAGSSSGVGTLNAPAAASSFVWTLPAATGTLVDLALAQTLTNKTLTSPILTTPALGTPSALVLTNATGLPLSGHTNQAAFTFVGNNTSGSAAPTAVDIAALTTKGSPAAGDYVMLSDQAASGAWKKATVSSVGSAGSVSSIAGNTGAFTLGVGITNSTNQIRLALTNATIQASPVNPGGATTTNVMMGLGSTCSITPVYSTRVRFEFVGGLYNNTASNTSSYNLRYGTGAAPANAAAATGTAVLGNTPVISHPVANAILPFSSGGIITGLTPGTAYWLDMSLQASANSSFFRDLSCTAMEF